MNNIDEIVYHSRVLLLYRTSKKAKLTYPDDTLAYAKVISSARPAGSAAIVLFLVFRGLAIGAIVAIARVDLASRAYQRNAGKRFRERFVSGHVKVTDCAAQR